MPPLFSRHIILKEGAEISYDKGKGAKKPPLLFLHGLGGNKDAWKEVRILLENQGWQTFAIDLRGHGLSQRPSQKEEYTIEKFADDVAWLIKKEDMAPPVIIGHCLGGMVALQLASTMPHMLSGLVLVATGTQLATGKNLAQQSVIQGLLSFGKTYGPFFQKKGVRDFSRLKGTGDYDVRRILADIFYTSPKSYLASLQTMTTFQGAPLLSAITAPTLLIAGGKDSLFPAAHMRQIQKGISHATLRTIPEVNHIVIINSPQALGTILASWLLLKDS